MAIPMYSLFMSQLRGEKGDHRGYPFLVFLKIYKTYLHIFA